MNKKLGVVWLRQDFRQTKNYALSYATNHHDLVSAVYIYKSKDFKKKDAQRWWIYKSIENFQKDLSELNINLEIEITDSYQSFFEKYTRNKNFTFYWNKIYEPNYLSFDNKISNILKKKEINFKIFKGNILNEYQEVKKDDGTPYKVFTPFWKIAEPIYLDKIIPKKLTFKKMKKKINFLENNKQEKSKILPNKNWYKKFENYWNPNEKNALKVCNNFVKEKIKKYENDRDIPGIKGTSQISPYLANGQLHVETVWEICSRISEKNMGYRKYINELGWREFSHSLINYFPEMLEGNLRKEFDNFPWVKNKKYLEAWKKGKTGYPIVDAGMRELYETGWMHNRVRMIVGSFLVKHLRIQWMEGEKYFRNCLLDFNEANNITGWQWVAGCGADAAPYFRVFNPILQGEKFDQKGLYIKKWIPELSKVPNDFIHKPWEMEDNQQREFKVIIGKNYPKPIVDHKQARESALNAFNKIKKTK